MRLGVVWESFVGGSDSIGIVAANTIEALDGLGVDVKVWPWNLSPQFRRCYYAVDRPVPDFYVWGQRAREQLSPTLRRLVERFEDARVSDIRKSVGILWGGFSHVHFSELRQTERRIGYFFCDFTSVPDVFRRYANAALDLIAVPSEFVRQAFQRSGITTPVVVWHHGIDPRRFEFTPREERPVFTFLFVGVAQFRKGLDLLLKAFTREFREDEAVRLMVKSADWGRVAEYRRAFGHRGIAWQSATVDASDVLAHYRGADCLVIPSRGEAFCLPGLEALATGLPVIYHDWGGQRDYGGLPGCYPVKSRKCIVGVRPWYGWTSPPLYAEVDIEELASVMRRVFEHREDAGQQARLGSREVHRGWTWAQRAGMAVHDIQRITGWRLTDHQLEARLRSSPRGGVETAW